MDTQGIGESSELLPSFGRMMTVQSCANLVLEIKAAESLMEDRVPFHTTRLPLLPLLLPFLLPFWLSIQ